METRSAQPRPTPGALGLVLLLVAGFALLPRVFGWREAPIVGKEAPDFELPLVVNAVSPASGRASVSLRELGGRAVVLDFWATWCPPCRAETPIVERIARRWRGDDVVVLGVDVDTPQEGDPRDFAVRYEMSYPIVHDATGRVMRAYQVETLPTLVIVSREGRVVAVRSGITDESEIERLLRQAL